MPASTLINPFNPFGLLTDTEAARIHAPLSLRNDYASLISHPRPTIQEIEASLSNLPPVCNEEYCERLATVTGTVHGFTNYSCDSHVMRFFGSQNRPTGVRRLNRERTVTLRDSQLRVPVDTTLECRTHSRTAVNVLRRSHPDRMGWAGYAAGDLLCADCVNYLGSLDPITGERLGYNSIVSFSNVYLRPIVSRRALNIALPTEPPVNVEVDRNRIADYVTIPDGNYRVFRHPGGVNVGRVSDESVAAGATIPVDVRISRTGGTLRPVLTATISSPGWFTRTGQMVVRGNDSFFINGWNTRTNQDAEECRSISGVMTAISVDPINAARTWGIARNRDPLTRYPLRSDQSRQTGMTRNSYRTLYRSVQNAVQR